MLRGERIEDADVVRLLREHRDTGFDPAEGASRSIQEINDFHERFRHVVEGESTVVSGRSGDDGRLLIEAWIAFEGMRRRLDARAGGSGSVRLWGLLTPVDLAAPSDGLVPDDYEGRFCGGGAVLEYPATRRSPLQEPMPEALVPGPRLCHTLMLSFPPRGGGPRVLGGDWATVEHEEARGTRWGTYGIVATWNEERLTLTQPPMAYSA